MEIEHKSIQTQGQYDIVAARIEQIKDAPAGSPEAMELKLLTKLVKEFAGREQQQDQGNNSSESGLCSC